MKILSTLICLTILMSSTFLFETKGWRGMVPMRSTRADVEAVLGQGTGPEKCSYYLDDMNVFFVYTSDRCEDGEARRWNVAPGTVKWITVYLKPQPKLSDLKIDESQYKKREIMDGVLQYINDKDGSSMEVQQGRVTTFLYGPSEGDDHLKCPGYDDTDFPSDMPKELRSRLLERLNQFVEYSLKRQYENKFELYLPDFAARFLGTTNKHEFVMKNNAGGFDDELAGFRPTDVSETKDEAYGKAYEVYGLAKTSENGKIVESHRNIRMILKDGEWYFIGFFRLLPL
jgi:hypothetical protein